MSLSILSGRIVALALTSAMLGGCSSLALLPPGVPSASQLASYAKTDFGPPYRVGATPRDTLVIGVAYVDQRCSEFFDAVEQMARKTEVLKSGFLTASNQALALMAIAKRSALAVARVAAATEITKVMLDEYREQFTFAPHASELRSLVMQAMTAQRKEFGILVRDDRLYSDIEVIAAVKKYAENCTLGTIREHWNNAVAKAVRDGVTPDTPIVAPAGAFISGATVFESAPKPQPSNVLGVNRYVVR